MIKFVINFNSIFMKKIILSFFAFLITITNTYSQDYQIKGEVKGVKDSICLLLRYGWEGKVYVKDSAKIKNYKFEFLGNEIKSGLYKIYFPQEENNFELIINDDRIIELSTSIENLVEEMNFKSSKENSFFYDYLINISRIQNKLLKIKSEKEELKSEKDMADLKNSQNLINKELYDLNNMFINKNKNSFFAKVLIANKQIEVPEPPILKNGKIDSLFQFKFYKKHFFDYIDFEDDRFLRTPIFYSKIKTYLSDLTVQIPDSIIVSCEYLVNKSKNNKEVFKYIVSFLTSNYERSKVMGFEKVFVHMVNNYYKTGQVYWLKENKLSEIIDRSNTIEPLMIGEKAPNLRLRDENEKIWDIHQIPADYTLMIFYDPDCGHCKKEMTKIKDIYSELIKDNIKIKVVTICVELEKEKWTEFITPYKLDNWINLGEFKSVTDGIYNPNNELATITHFPYLRDLYDIIGTPKIYLLDKDKKILTNAVKGNIGVEQIKEYILRDFIK